jgi:hypothetical protein
VRIPPGRRPDELGQGTPRAKDFGHRRHDNLAYVGKRTSGWWCAYVRTSADANFKPLDQYLYATDQQAMADADAFLEGKVAA